MAEAFYAKPKAQTIDQVRSRGWKLTHQEPVVLLITHVKVNPQQINPS